MDDIHDFCVTCYDGELIIDKQPRGGLVIQVGVLRDGEVEWNFVTLPKRLADQVRKFLRETPQKGS